MQIHIIILFVFSLNHNADNNPNTYFLEVRGRYERFFFEIRTVRGDWTSSYESHGGLQASLFAVPVRVVNLPYRRWCEK